jgi:hypothetical protein
MPNKTIPQLPEQTGKTDDDLLVIVDSGETTTSKIKVSTLLDGVGAAGVTGDTLNDNISSVNSIVGIPNIFSGTTGYVNFGYSNKVWDESVIYGYNNVPTRATVPAGEICIGMDNNYHSNFGGSEGGSMVIGKNNTKRNDGMIIGDSNTGSRGMYFGLNNNSGNSNDIAGMSIFGRNNTTGSIRGAIIGSYNTNGGDFGTIVGFNNNHNNRSWAVSIGYNNNINSNGSSSEGQNIAIGTSNTITGGLGQFNISVESDITSTGTHNTIVGGYGNSITGTTSGTTIIGLTGYTATEDDTTYVKHSKNVGQSVNTFYNNLSGDTFTIDWNEGNLQKIYMTGDTSLTLSNVKDGATYKLQVENGGTHNVTSVSASGFTILCEGGSYPNFTNNAIDMCILDVMGTDILVRHITNFSTP